MSKKKIKDKTKSNKNELSKGFEYYTLNNVLSYNANLNFVTSSRGLGKTTTAAIWFLKTWERDGSHFVYLRRNEDEKVWGSTLFENALEVLDNKYEVKLKGNMYFIREAVSDEYVMNEDGEMEKIKNDEKPWQLFGFFAILAFQQNMKGGVFHKVNKIVFDEFIIESDRQRYLTNETVVLAQLYSSIDRWRDTTKLVCLSNAGAMTNPYFAEYNIRAEDLSTYGIKIRRNGSVAFEYVDPEPYKELWENSKVSDWAPVEWQVMAQENQFADRSYINVSEKPKGATPNVVIHYGMLSWTIYNIPDSPELWVKEGEAGVPDNKHLNANWSNPNANMVFMTKGLRKTLKDMIQANKVKYSTPESKNGFFDLIMLGKL